MGIAVSAKTKYMPASALIHKPSYRWWVFAASIVTAVTVGAGYEVKIDAVLDAAPGDGLLESFLDGLKTAFLGMAALQVIGAVITIFKTDPKPELPADAPHEADYAYRTAK